MKLALTGASDRPGKFAPYSVDSNPTDIGELRLGVFGQYRRRQFDFKTTSPGADKNTGEGLSRVIDKSAQSLLLPQRTDATQQITRRPLCRRRVGHFDFFHPGRVRQVL